MPERSLYFLALVPPENSLRLLWDLKQEIALNYSTKASLRSPPHITLHMPFLWPDSKYPQLVRELTYFSHNHQPVQASMDGFGAFPPKVIYVNVESNSLLTNLQQELCRLMAQKMSIYNANYRNQAFTPHITIAFRDLKKPMFQQAWNQYRDQIFQTSCLIENITLLRHDNRKWQRHQDFEFNPNMVS